MVEDTIPVFSRIPRDLARRINFDRHNLADACALDDDDGSADTAIMTTPFFTALDVSDNEWIADIRAGNNVSTRHRKSGECRKIVSSPVIKTENIMKCERCSPAV